jgi:hypothetical protein
MNDQELLETKAKLRLHRVRANFEKNHRGRGGLRQLQRMVANTETLEVMSEWFGISGPRLSNILLVLLGMPYSDYLASKNVQRSGVNNAH